jgi:formate hydrogenlyase subunit 3/multisubunit Na+/H+ antiporter MnhD subunit
MGEILTIVLMFTGFSLPFIIAAFRAPEMWWWVGMWACVGIVFAVFEILAKVKTGRTLSQKFWYWSEDHPVGKWFVLLSMILGWLALIFHLTPWGRGI